MFPSDRFCRIQVVVSALFMAWTVLPVKAAMDASFELDPQALGVSAASKKPAKSDRRPSKSRMDGYSTTGGSENVVYTIKSGDNLFKILMRDYGLSNKEADSFIGVVCRENNISDIRNLKIGQKIVIPPLPRKGRGTARRVKASSPETAKSLAGGQMFRLESPEEAALSELEASEQIRQTWNKLLPPLTDAQKPTVLQSPSFSLTLDPQRYPVYAAMDNGRILIDRNASIPPLVKALISDKDPSVRIVSESPRNGKRFLSAMLESAKFYSVEEDFSMEFGADPKLTIHSDFKVEKSAESLITQDLVLMNAGRRAYPLVIKDFLKKEGFTVYEPFASSKPGTTMPVGQLYQVLSQRQSDIVDTLLSSISVVPEKDRRLDVFAADNNGISLSVKAERYFERGGQRYVVTSFDGDPVAYTLYRILETKGFQVAILEGRDDFRKISEKILSHLHIPAAYAQHTFTPETGGNYTLQLSGFILENPEYPVGGVFLTNLELDRVIRDLLADNGYSVVTK